MKIHQKRSDQGFTLVEILIAFSILAIAMVELFQGFSTNLQNVETTVAYGEALQIAESRLAVVGTEIPMMEGETSGDIEGFRWNILIVPYETDEVPSTDNPLALFQVTIQVSWVDPGRKEQTVSMTTLHLGKKR